MNRKKKINSILKKKAKKANEKFLSSNKPKYVSKAERARLELEAQVKMKEQSSELSTGEDS
ncbi:MAG: DUF2986 domain-containing protein [Alteromonadaceae bacterium]|nr:DUF2986 domain-containing protein [Alteromonadaceae bacterium]